jgi:hypothetical protein
MPGSDSQHITDARVLRAMAHPLRIKILNALALMDIGTATQIAEAGQIRLRRGGARRDRSQPAVADDRRVPNIRHTGRRR